MAESEETSKEVLIQLTERHYAVPKSTENFRGVLTEVDPEGLEYVEQTISLREHQGRRLGVVRDETKYYTFLGKSYIMRNGDAEIGTGRNGANQQGFHVARLSANSPQEMLKLERECGVYGPPPEHPPWNVE
jgi:hypothetical protein